MNDTVVEGKPTKDSQLKNEVEKCLKDVVSENILEKLFSFIVGEGIIDIRVRSFYPSEHLRITIIRIDTCPDGEVLTIWLKPNTVDIHTASINIAKLCALKRALNYLEMKEVSSQNPDTFAFQRSLPRDKLIPTLNRVTEIIANY